MVHEGGVAIMCSNSFGTIKKLNVSPPPELEIIWAEIVPHHDPGSLVVVGCFYASNSAKHRPPKDLLQQHVVEVVDQLSTENPHRSILVGGDKNGESLQNLLEIGSFVSHVNQPTRGQSFLDVAISNMKSKN